MSDIAGSIWWLIVALGVLVTFHEFGHYWVARRCGGESENDGGLAVDGLDGDGGVGVGGGGDLPVVREGRRGRGRRSAGECRGGQRRLGGERGGEIGLVAEHPADAAPRGGGRGREGGEGEWPKGEKGEVALGGDAAATGGDDLVDAVRCSLKASCNAAMRTWLCLRTTGTST